MRLIIAMTVLAQNEYGWWKVNNGEVDFSFDGLALNEILIMKK